MNTAERCRILLVDDDEMNRNIIEDVIGIDDVPAQLLSVDTGEEALEIIERFRPNLILMDLSLPGISGYEVMKQVRRMEPESNLEIWVVSANAMTADCVRVSLAGSDDFITKPLSTCVTSQFEFASLQRNTV